MVCKKFFAVLMAAVFLLCGALGAFAQVEEDDEVIKVDTALVNVPFSVSDREGRSILGLTAQNFSLSLTEFRSFYRPFFLRTARKHRTADFYFRPIGTF